MLNLLIISHLIGFFIVPAMARERRRDVASWLAFSLFFTSIASIILLILLGVDKNKPERINTMTKELKDKEEEVYWRTREDGEIPITALSDYDLDSAMDYLYWKSTQAKKQSIRNWANNMLDKMAKEKSRRILSQKRTKK